VDVVDAGKVTVPVTVRLGNDPCTVPVPLIRTVPVPVIVLPASTLPPAVIVKPAVFNEALVSTVRFSTDTFAVRTGWRTAVFGISTLVEESGTAPVDQLLASDQSVDVAPVYTEPVKVVVTRNCTMPLVPPVVVTVRSRVPRDAPEAIVNVVVIVVLLTTVTVPAVTPDPVMPMVAPLTKFVPVRVTGTAAPTEPEDGLIDVRVGG
jgi:hypothetical protein